MQGSAALVCGCQLYSRCFDHRDRRAVLEWPDRLARRFAEYAADARDKRNQVG